MKSLDKPIALVEAQNTGNASRASDTVTIGLASMFFSCVNVRVIMVSNALQCHGLCNGSTGIVHDIFYKCGELAPALPKYVLVGFDYQYKGPIYFHNDKN